MKPLSSKRSSKYELMKLHIFVLPAALLHTSALGRPLAPEVRQRGLGFRGLGFQVFGALGLWLAVSWVLLASLGVATIFWWRGP